MNKSVFALLALLFLPIACAQTYTTAKPVVPKIYQKSFNAAPNQIYYALRWALPTYGYPIAAEDLHNGVITSHYVPVKARSHYVAIFNREDYGVSGAYHQLEVRLIPRGGQTDVQVSSRIQAVVKNIRSTGKQEKLILGKIGDYLRSDQAQITNLGIQE